MLKKTKTLPGGQQVVFTDRQAMKRGHPLKRLSLSCFSMPPVQLPVDWTRGNTLSFPMLGNDRYGDCMEVAACHADQTWTGCNGSEQSFDIPKVVAQYEKASGGDNGLDESLLLTQCWKPGLAGVADATYLDFADVDPTNAPLCQAIIRYFGGLLFMLDVPDAWLGRFLPQGGGLWDAPAVADQNNGHGVWWNGVDSYGRYKLQTWGSYVWITPAGVRVCDPSAFAVFSLRWFNSAGIAPNGMSYSDLAALWQQLSGHTLPPSPFPPGPGPSPSQPIHLTLAPSDLTPQALARMRGVFGSGGSFSVTL